MNEMHDPILNDLDKRIAHTNGKNMEPLHRPAKTEPLHRLANKTEPLRRLTKTEPLRRLANKTEPLCRLANNLPMHMPCICTPLTIIKKYSLYARQNTKSFSNRHNIFKIPCIYDSQKTSHMLLRKPFKNKII